MSIRSHRRSDGSNPQDWRNQGRALAHFDCREIEGSPADEQFTTIVTGLKANNMEFGLPFHLGANMVALKGLDERQMTFFVEACHEVEENEDEIDAELAESFAKAVAETPTCDDDRFSDLMGKVEIDNSDCADPWHDGDQTTACPSCAMPPF